MRNPVDHPTHYQSIGKCSLCKHPIEAIQVTEEMSFVMGNAAKYLLRCGRKGDPVEDLLKARWYIDREIDRLRGDGE